MEKSMKEHRNQEKAETKPKKKKKHFTLPFYIFGAIGLFLIIYFGYQLFDYKYAGYQYKKDNEKLLDIVGDISKDKLPPDDDEPTLTQKAETDAGTTENTATVVPVKASEWPGNYDTLKETNKDCIGWIKIPDTNIDYPVMFTPNDPEKYLHTSFYGKYQFRGLPFLDANSTLQEDMTDNNIIIYGHNMNDGTGFQNLKFYLDDEWGMKHRYCYLNLEYDEGIYELVGVVLTHIYTANEKKGFEYYNYSGSMEADKFIEYSKNVVNERRYDTGCDPILGDTLVTLSMCYRVHHPDGRLIVVFRKIN